MKTTYILLFCFAFFISGAQKNTQKEIDSLEKLIQNPGTKEQGLMDKAALVSLYNTAGQKDKCLTMYKSALQEAKSLKLELPEAQLYHNYAIMYFYEYILDSAVHYFDKALVIRKRIKDNPGTLKTTSNLASIYFMQSDFKKSLEYFNDGLKLEAELGYEEGKYIDLKNMAIAFQYLRLYTKAIACYRKAEKHATDAAKNYYTINSGIAMTFHEMKQNDSALFYAMKALKIADNLHDTISLGYSYSTVGIIYNSLEKYDLAMENFNIALKISKSTNEKRLEIASQANIAGIYQTTNKVDLADPHIERVLVLQKELNIQLDEGDLSKLLGDYYHRKGQHEKAYEYFKKYDSYKDSIYNLESAAKMIEFQEKFETEKKEKENQLLQVENKSFKTSRNYLFAILMISVLGLILIIAANRKILISRRLLSIQKNLVEEKQKEILDSIHYAKRIQYALLASDTLLNKHLPEHFILFKPKDVVSGDFYWAASTNNGFVYLTGDCTGHGVPGAFMSLLFISKLNQAVIENEISRPDLILNDVRHEIVTALNPEGSKEESKDGMDAVLCRLDLKRMKLEFAAANNSFYIIRDKEILHCHADKMSVGKGINDSGAFTSNEIQLQSGDLIYTFTDGIADQFGGPSGKKFKYKQFEALLLNIHKEPMSRQKLLIDEAFEKWKGLLEQVDDVCIIGVKIP